MKNRFAALMCSAMLMTSMFAAPALSVSAAGASAAASEAMAAGEYENGSWAFDAVTGTLTLTGEQLAIRDPENVPWKGYEEQIGHIVIPYNMQVGSSYTAATDSYLYHLADDITAKHPDGFSWTFEPATQTLTLSGKGGWPKFNDWEWSNWGFVDYVDHVETLVIGDGITHISHSTLNADTVVLGADVQLSNFIWDNYVRDSFIVSRNNPYYAAYDNCLYSRDYKTLYSVPRNEVPDFHPNLETVGSHALQTDKKKTLVLPWGVKTLEDSAISFQTMVILPDTVASIGDYNFGAFTYSAQNTAAAAYMNGFGKESSVKAAKADTVASYYGITPSCWKTFGDKTYYFDKDGKMTTGKVKIDGQEYFFGKDGVLVGDGPENTESENTPAVGDGWISSVGKTYYYKDGKMLTGLQYIDGKAYYFGEDGVRQDSGWVYADGNWYYLSTYGAGVVNCWRDRDGKYYYLGADGKMKTNCWLQDYGSWYYLKADGSRYESCWAKIGGAWYWFGGSGKMAENTWLKLADGKWYYFHSTGAMAANQWVKTGGKWYYLGGNGAMAANRWVKSGAYWYCLGSDGAMLTNTTTPDGYRVDAQGRWTK